MQEKVLLKNEAYKRRFILAAIILILTTLYIRWETAKEVNFLPCVTDCGETFGGTKQVNNFKLYGFKYGLLEDHATSNDLNAHPHLYTHNASIPTILFPLLEWLGFKSFAIKQFVTLLAFGIGLFYAFWCTLYYSKSYWLGLILLIFFCTDYINVFSFGLNALRAWHWLVLFGLLYHTGRFFNDLPKGKWFNYIANFLLVLLAFGIGYEFWMIMFCMVMIIALLALIEAPFLWRSIFKKIFIIGAFFAIPAVLRQIHVASVVGFDFWFSDFKYSIAIKVLFLKEYFHLPDLSEIDAYYKLHHVMRAPSSPGGSWSESLITFKDLIYNVVVGGYGILSILIAGSMTLLIAIYYIYFTLNSLVPNKTKSLIEKNIKTIKCNHMRRYLSYLVLSFKTLRRELKVLLSGQFYFIKGGVKQFFILSIGALIGMSVFMPLTLHVYLKHRFPLLAAPILLAKSLVLMVVAISLLKLFLMRSGYRWVMLLLLVFLPIDHLLIQKENLDQSLPISMHWIKAVEARKHASFAVSWVSNAVASFTEDWVVGLVPGTERKISERIHQGKPPFEFSDYFLFGQQDIKAKGNKYLRPDYWLYFPVEQANQFDAPTPICQKDYISDALEFINSMFHRPKIQISYENTSSVFLPGHNIAIYGQFLPTSPAIEKIELISNGKILTVASYNCIYKKFHAVYKVPRTYSNTVLNISIFATYNKGKKKEVGKIILFKAKTRSQYYKDIGEKEKIFREPQMSVDEIIAANPQLTVSDQGPGYVIFDMRRVYKKTP